MASNYLEACPAPDTFQGDESLHPNLHVVAGGAGSIATAQEVQLGKSQLFWLSRIMDQPALEQLTEEPVEQQEKFVQQVADTYGALSVRGLGVHVKEQRVVQFTHFMQGRTYSEIGRITDRPMSTIRSGLTSMAEIIAEKVPREKIHSFLPGAEPYNDPTPTKPARQKSTRPKKAPVTKSQPTKKRTAVRRTKQIKTTQEAALALDKPFVDYNQAEEIVPFVFKEKYDLKTEVKKNKDRPLLRAMNRHFHGDNRIKKRIITTYGSTQLRSGFRNSLTDDAADDILREGGQYRLLKKAEVYSLVNRMHLGVIAFRNLKSADDSQRQILMDLSHEGSFAYQALFHCNLRLPGNTARRAAFFYPSVTAGDTLHYGYEGLQEAIEKFDPAKGYEFSTYAMFWVRQKIQRGLQNEGRTIRMPVHVEQQARRLEKTEERLKKELARDPTFDELVAESGLEYDDVLDIVVFGGKNVASLNQLVGDDGDTELGEFIPGPDSVEREVIGDPDNASLDELLREADLPKIEKVVLSIRRGVLFDELVGEDIYGQPYEEIFDQMKRDKNGLANMDDVGRPLGMNRNEVSRIEQRAFGRIHVARETLQLRAA